MVQSGHVNVTMGEEAYDSSCLDNLIHQELNLTRRIPLICNTLVS